jgi:sec-independent protein translocase protein TatB
MFDVAPTELLLLGTVALLVIPPKDLPKAMRVAGYWVGRARGVARQFRSGFDSMLRDAELQEMEKRWAEENARIMREHPPTPAMLMSPAPGDLVEESEAPVMTEMPAVGPVTEPVPVAEAPPKPKRKSKPKAKPDLESDQANP